MKQTLKIINLPKLTTFELNILIYFMYKMYTEKGPIVLKPSEISKLNKHNTTNLNLLKILEILHEKITDDKCEICRLFDHFQIFENTKLSYVRLVKNETYVKLLEQLISNFSRKQITTFLNLKSKYSKLLYLLFKQCKNKRKNAYFKDNFEGFKAYMNISDENRMSDIDKTLKYAIKELATIYPNIQYIKTKDKRYKGQGGIVKGIIFNFENLKDKQ